MPHLWLPRRSRREFLRAAAASAAAAVSPWPAAHAQAGDPAFEAVPAARSGITWVHDNAMSEFRYLPETCGSGCAFLDYDGDGWMDIYLVNSGPADIYTPKTPIRNALYRNNRDGTFTDVTEQAGAPGGTFGMGVAVGDFDNDGFPDLFVTSYGNCTLYRNNGTFTDITEKAGLRVPGWTTSAVWFDYDNDGRLDVLINNNGGAPVLLHNRSGRSHHWVGLSLQGVTCNRDAIGARISWSVGGKVTRRFKTGGGSYLSSHDPREVLGLGSATQVDWVEIAWPAPSTRVDRLTNVKIDAYHKVVEGKGIV